MEIPVACTLGAEDSARRVEEWRRFLENSVLSADAAGPELLRLLLDPSAETLVAAVDLARREKSCCRFFDFSIDVQEDGSWLVVAVPPDAVRDPGRLLSPCSAESVDVCSRASRKCRKLKIC